MRILALTVVFAAWWSDLNGDGAADWSPVAGVDYAAADHSHPGGSEAFPVGAIFISISSTNPGTSLGYGTWSAFGVGRTVVSLDSGQTEFDVVEETGGAKTHTLTAAEMPSHTHVQDPHTHTLTGGPTDDTSAPYPGPDAANSATVFATTGIQAATAVNQSTGGGGAHNNLQPYIVVYMWKRTA
jgi:hypothetical protein